MFEDGRKGLGRGFLPARADRLAPGHQGFFASGHFPSARRSADHGHIANHFAGTTPPLIIQYSASTVPILQYGIRSTSLSEQEIYDLTLNQIRVGLISVPGVGIPLPYGGVSVDLDLKGLESDQSFAFGCCHCAQRTELGLSQRHGENTAAKAAFPPQPHCWCGGGGARYWIFVGTIPHWHQNKVLNTDTQQLAIATVAVVSPAPGKSAAGLMLPAEIRPWLEASIYARVSGYLETWLVDIGAHVKEGQVLAEIDTPELDQQLEQARAQLVLAEANLKLAKTTDDRWQGLVQRAAISEQEAAEKAAARAVMAANVQAAAAMSAGWKTCNPSSA